MMGGIAQHTLMRYRALTFIAFIYCIWAVVGSGATAVMWTLVIIMGITAMYTFNYNTKHKAPYPLEAPVDKG